MAWHTKRALGKVKIFRQNTAPTRGAEFNFRHPTKFLCRWPVASLVGNAHPT